MICLNFITFCSSFPLVSDFYTMVISPPTTTNVKLS